MVINTEVVIGGGGNDGEIINWLRFPLPFRTVANGTCPTFGRYCYWICTDLCVKENTKRLRLADSVYRHRHVVSSF